jgi:hypothetical protein
MFILKLEDYNLINMIRTAGNPTDSPNGVQIAREFLDSLSEDQSRKLDEIKNNLGPDAFRDLIFRAVGDVETEEELLARKEEEEKRRREEEVRQKFNMPEDRPVALPEEEHIMLRDERSKWPDITDEKDPKAILPHLQTDDTPTVPFKISRPVPTPVGVSRQPDFSISKEDKNNKGWWERFNSGNRR